MAVINLSNGDDLQDGTNDSDTINGLGGNDTLNGLGGMTPLMEEMVMTFSMGVQVRIAWKVVRAMTPTLLITLAT